MVGRKILFRSLYDGGGTGERRAGLKKVLRGGKGTRGSWEGSGVGVWKTKSAEVIVEGEKREVEERAEERE